MVIGEIAVTAASAGAPVAGDHAVGDLQGAASGVQAATGCRAAVTGPQAGVWLPPRPPLASLLAIVAPTMASAPPVE